MSGKHLIVPIFVPHKGCPFDCIYCNQKSISGQKSDLSEEEMRSIIESYISTAECGTHVEIGFYGGSFTGIEKEHQLKYLKIANFYVNKGLVKEIRLSTRPDYIDEAILKYLKEYNVKTIELGVQSLDEEVLRKSCRGHGVEEVFSASLMIKSGGFKLGIQTMIGLPGDNREKCVYTARKVVELRPDMVRIYPTLVIKNTYLEKMYNLGDYVPLSLEEAVDICSELLGIYESNGINVIRIGLQPTDNINEKGDVVAGPFHPAFRQLVESRLMLDKIEKIITAGGLENSHSISLYANPRSVSAVIGQRRVNIHILKEKFGFKRIAVAGDCSIEPGVVKAEKWAD